MEENVFCVNCGSASGCMALQDAEILHCIQQWNAPRLIQAADFICTICWREAQATTITISGAHCISQKCALCKVALPHRTRSHQIIALRTDSLHYVNIKNIILERLIPVQIRASHYICHPCWQRADRAAKHYSAPSTSRTTAGAGSQLKCANCCLNITRLKRHILNNEAILRVIQQRVAPQLVTTADYICDACYLLLTNDEISNSGEAAHSVGHEYVCIHCGYSVAQLRHFMVQAEENHHILNIVQNWIYPREIQSTDVICFRCFRRAETESRTDPVPAIDPVPQRANIFLLISVV